MLDWKPEPIAIVGMACRLPRAEDLSQLWKLVLQGDDATSEVPAERWDRQQLHDPDWDAPGKIHTWRGGFLRDVESCDWRALRLLPREARHMDPQHRLLLELAWEALEDAGLSFEAVAGSRTGVFVGIGWNDFQRLLARDWSRLNGYAVVGNAPMLAANRVSFSFDLRGPSLAVDCGCASGLTALQLACHNLWLGEADLALVGGVELILSPDSMIAAEGTGMISRQGSCRPLDADGDGFVRGEGAGVLVLKPASRVSPADRVYALVQGVAVNHNGRNEWIMAANADAQAEVLLQACRQAGVAPCDLDYVELHGTGHPKGDLLEVAALGRALAGPGRRAEPCRLGALKAQLGHLGRASGIAALIKAALALFHRQIPPMRGPERLHPDLRLEEAGFALPARPLSWPAGGRPALAGVTALSLGGANAHAVLAEPGPRERPAAAGAGERPMVLPLSTRCAPSLVELVRRYIAWLSEGEGAAPLEDICFTAGAGRSHHEHRIAVAGRSRRELVQRLNEVLPGLEAGLPGAAPGPEGDLPARLEKAAVRYREGGAVDWAELVPAGGRVTSLPLYPWQRVRMWPEWLDARTVSTPPEVGGRAAADGTDGEGPARPQGAFRAELEQAPAGERKPLLARFLRDQVERVLQLRVDTPGLDDNPRLTELGLDSLSAHELRARLELELGVSVPTAAIFQAGSTDSLSDLLLAQLRRQALLQTLSARPAVPEGECEVLRL